MQSQGHRVFKIHIANHKSDCALQSFGLLMFRLRPRRPQAVQHSKDQIMRAIQTVSDLRQIDSQSFSDHRSRQKVLKAQRDRDADRQKPVITVVEVLARLHSLTTPLL